MDVRLIPVDQLELDLCNPRIARMLEMFDPMQITSEQIALALGAGDSQEGDTYTTFYSLKESIRTHGGIIQPIIVNELTDGRLVVIEGNTRLAA
ncbi:MAG: ParB/Srx family N-terminal domain-containing protein [Planctomycetes bacterium]|nr:ParB/Srx family N-terminal domain-containing protein [Planctomycetota bacterium]